MVPAVSEKATKSELKAILKNEVLLLKVYTLENLLKNFYDTRRPSPSEYANRRDMIRIFNLIAKEIYRKAKGKCKEQCPVIKEFGSFVMDMFSSDSDLDLSITFDHNRTNLKRAKKVKTLRRFAKKFHDLQSRGFVRNIQEVLTARVPIIKVTDCGTGIECDLSVENKDGIAKSLIISEITVIDERFQKLSVMLKAWAKTQEINSSKDGTFNSLSLISLAAFHLQCQEPPILPPFSSIIQDGLDVPNVKRNIERFLNFGRKNQDSVVKLFVTLLIRLNSVRTLWPEGLCASIYKGSWIHKTFNDKNKNIFIEDFSDRSQNVARAVGSAQFFRIYDCIEHSLDLIRSFTDGNIGGKALRHLLFGPDPSPEIKSVVNHDNFTISKTLLVDPTPEKKARITGEWGGGVPSTSLESRDRAIVQSRNYLAERLDQNHGLLRSGEVSTSNIGIGQMRGRIHNQPERLSVGMNGYQPSKPFLVDPTPEKKARITGEWGGGGVPSTSSWSREYAIVQSRNYLTERHDQNHAFLRSEEPSTSVVGVGQMQGRIHNQPERLSAGVYGYQPPTRVVQGAWEGLRRCERTHVRESREEIKPHENHRSNWNPWASNFASPSLLPDMDSSIGSGIHYRPPNRHHSSVASSYPRLGSGSVLGSDPIGMAPPQITYVPELMNRTHVHFNVPNQKPRGANPHYFL